VPTSWSTAGIRRFEKIFQVGAVDFDEIAAVKGIHSGLDMLPEDFELQRRVVPALRRCRSWIPVRHLSLLGPQYSTGQSIRGGKTL
jgi:hypothetical protein